MIKRVVALTVLEMALFGLSLFAGSPFSGSWTSEVELQPGTNAFKSLDSLFKVNYSFGSLVSASDSEVFLPGGFIWQGFGVTGKLGPLSVQADLLFGPSTNDFVYAQEIFSLSLVGVDLGVYWATLSGVVLGGPADGFALRVAGSAGSVKAVSVTEFGARIQDEDVDGITIVHATTGRRRSYLTNPLVRIETPPVYGDGRTGEKITVSGFASGCVENIATTVYLTEAGFDFFKITLAGIELGLSWLEFDLTATFELQTKSVAMAPTFHLGTTTCLVPYVEVLTDAPDHTLYPPFTSFTGISLYGIGLEYSWGGVTVKDLTVFDTGRYAITTPEYGSVIEEIAEALERGHDVTADTWELFSVEVSVDGCCGGASRLLVNTYFQKGAGGAFGWGMTYAEATAGISSGISLTANVELKTTGLDHFGLGVEAAW